MKHPKHGSSAHQPQTSSHEHHEATETASASPSKKKTKQKQTHEHEDVRGQEEAHEHEHPHENENEHEHAHEHHPKQRTKHHPAHMREQHDEEHPSNLTYTAWPLGGREIAMQIEVFPRYVPEGTNALYLQGDHPQLGKGREKGLRLHLHGDGAWRNTVRLKAGEGLHFKVHRGDSESLAVDSEGRPIIFHASLQQSGSFAAEVYGWLDRDYHPKPTIKGRLELHRKMTYPGIRERDILVWLPSSYDSDPQRRYPVLYMHDGQNLFDPATAYAGVEWAVDENIEQLEREGRIDTPIVVGLKNTPDRLEEYVPTDQGYAYMRFIVEVVKPMIDHRYRTRPDRENTAVMGSSLGGLASFLLVWCYPHLFSKAGCLSPVFHNRKELNVDVCSWVEQYDGPPKDIRLYIDNGGQGLEYRLMPGCRRMVKLLEKRGYQHGKDLAWYLDKDAHHNESAWAARLWRPLTFLFGEYKEAP
ncbi:MAG: histidine kinase [Myxococcales bacterium]|nr:histidine kinase [Myxococcales bacterium]